MKTLFLTTIIAGLVSSISSTAQNSVHMDSVMITAQLPVKPLFQSIKIENQATKSDLKFRVSSVKNVRSYRIEAGDSPNAMEIVGEINKPMNSMLAKDFDYDLADIEQHYKYYRIVQISMDHNWTYSPTVENMEKTQTDLIATRD